MGGRESALRIKTLFLKEFNNIREWTFPPWMVPFALLVTCVISYGILANKLGYYWDDWTIAYYIHFFKSSIFKEVFIEDRPLLGWVYVMTTSLLGESPFRWQVFAVITRWLACTAFWWTLKGLWPGRTVKITAIALLFAVYPGFQQQFIAITYGNAFCIYACFLVSMGAMVWALRDSQNHPAGSWFWLLYSLSVVSSGIAMFTLEYFFGLELLRPVFLWLILSETIPDLHKRIKRVGLFWLPYISLIVLFLSWRITHQTTRGDILLFDKLKIAPLSTLFTSVQTIIQDIFKTSIIAWGKPFEISNLLTSNQFVIRNYFIIVLGVFILTVLILANLRIKRNSKLHDDKRGQITWSLQAIAIGVFALVVAGIPFWTTQLPISLSFPRDRFTLPFMVGASILLFGLIDALPKIVRLQSIVIIGIAVGLATGMHYQTALSYYKEWLEQKNFFWQLTWRAPWIQPRTTILTTEMPFPYDSDNSLTSALNWIYAPENTSTEFLYSYFNVESYISRKLSPLKDGMPIEIRWRLTNFKGSTSQALFVVYREQSCLMVINPRFDRALPEKPRFYRETLPFSKPELIIPKEVITAQLPMHLLGPEPVHDWCYFFEKAELARQQDDWQKIAEIGDQVLGDGKKFYRRNVAELAPFIEGYVHLGQWEKATKLSLEAYQAWHNMRILLCDIWNRAYQAGQIDAQGLEAFEEIQQTLTCSEP